MALGGSILTKYDSPPHRPPPKQRRHLSLLIALAITLLVAGLTLWAWHDLLGRKVLVTLAGISLMLFVLWRLINNLRYGGPAVFLMTSAKVLAEFAETVEEQPSRVAAALLLACFLLLLATTAVLIRHGWPF